MGQAIAGHELRAILRYALHVTTVTSNDAASTQEGSTIRNPAFRRLIEEILFSRRFIHTYHAVIGCLLLVFTAAHWGRKLLQWRRRRGDKDRFKNDVVSYPTESFSKTEVTGLDIESVHEGSSSSGSTLDGTLSPPERSKLDTEDNERTSLLPRTQETSRAAGKVSLGRKLRAWLMYQPKPIPYVDKPLPSNSTTLTVFTLYAINIFYTFYHVPISIPMLFAFADRTSLVFVVNLPILYLFAAKNQPIKAFTGYSYESLNILHRRLGEMMCLLAFLHSAGMVGVWYTLLRPSGITFGGFLLSKIILLGLGAFVAYETLYLTSLSSFRKRWYELFLGLHISLQTVALILLWFHHHGSRIYVAIALAIFLIDRLIFRMTITSKTFQAALHVYEDRETIGLHISVPLSKSQSLVNQILATDITYGWQPTHHIFLTIPSLSCKHIIQAHPFTIASQAPSLTAESTDLDLIIRAQDGFSSDLLGYAKGHGSVPVRIDGPYGSQSAVDLVRYSDLSIIIAGGSGIAVGWPLVWSAIAKVHNDDSELAFSNVPTKRIVLVWIVQKASHLTWIGESQLASLRAHGASLVVPPPTLENGRPDITHIIELCVSDQVQGVDNEHCKVGVVCSGPDGMNRTVRNTCSKLLGEGINIAVEIEKFGW